MSRLESIVGSVLAVDPGGLKDTDGPTTIESWDSLNHIMLAGAIEEAYGVSLSADELMSASTLGDFRRLLRTRGCDV
ncbi:MAG: hypothetical protein AMXMBFR36_02840 [Acidobacteriota bacterium]